MCLRRVTQSFTWLNSACLILLLPDLCSFFYTLLFQATFSTVTAPTFSHFPFYVSFLGLPAITKYQKQIILTSLKARNPKGVDILVLCSSLFSLWSPFSFSYGSTEFILAYSSFWYLLSILGVLLIFSHYVPSARLSLVKLPPFDKDASVIGLGSNLMTPSILT